ncbi:MAG: arsenate reductase ArsC [Gemmatimonadaceae bacterium]|jgi:arsenate reductase
MTAPLRLLVLCTRNSARSQMAEALFAAEGAANIVVASAGSDPGPGVHPLAVEVLAEVGIDWRGRPSRSIDDVAHESWDAVITVCDAARDACPYLPGARATAHWGLVDPAAVEGEHAVQLAAFRAAREHLHAAVLAFVAIPPASPALTEASNTEALHTALAAGKRALDGAVAQANSPTSSSPSSTRYTDALRPHL